MNASARAFLSEIIDYAGLFPPAKLPMDEALRIYFRERATSPHRWMLGRFVCPAARLQEMVTLAKTHDEAPLLSLTALGQQSSHPADFRAGIQADIRAIQDFRRAWGKADTVDQFEVPLPKGADVDPIARQLALVAADLHDANLRGFFEIPQGPNWRANVDRLTHDLQSLGQKHLGLKLRCGGVTAEAFPTDEEVAFFIARCRVAGLPWKATAGLHHPRRHRDAALRLWHHGFLNVFGAGVLAWTNSLTEADLVEILADREGRHFRFDEDTFAWKNWSCTAAQIADARTNGATTFGSCSFDEPCQDLVAMGLIDGAEM